MGGARIVVRPWVRAGLAGAVGLACLMVVPVAGGAASAAPGCDPVPTHAETSDYWLHFRVPPGLMPDSQFDGRPAKLHVHRVRPGYAHGKCADVQARAVVLIHGRTISGSAVFDVRDPGTSGGSISLQERLARAGIDTFAPSLLGYGLSTRFDEGLNDPANASLRPYLSDGSCPHPEGCDRTHNPIFGLDQQRTELRVNPLAGERRAHSSSVRFARTDVWVRDIRQVVDDAIERAQPANGKVTLLGYSLGAQRVGRSLYPANPVVPTAGIIAKVDRAVFLAPFFGGPTEETTPPSGFVTFPLTLTKVGADLPGWQMAAEREEVCTGHYIEGVREQVSAQILKNDTVGRNWGGDDPEHPTGLNRSPTFSSYGWNTAVAGQLVTPTLIMQGLDDSGVPGGPTAAPAVYGALPASMTNKVLVQVDCATHEFITEGCAEARCMPSSGTPYGGQPGERWAGPHATLRAALIEWIKHGTFDNAPTGRFLVDKSGVATPASP